MRLHIVQHGAALSKEEDESRPLSGQGRADVQSLAEALSRAGVSNCSVLHSTKLRARQTGEILAGGVMGHAAEAQGLGPKDDLAPWLERLGRERRELVLVGHQPFVGRLATRLLTGADDPSIVAFEPGTAVSLERADEGWTVRWMIGPAMLPIMT